MSQKATKIEDYLGKQIPIEILQQLIVESRVSFPLGPTSTSAISSSASEPSTLDDDAIKAIIDHVKEMESLLEHAEDMIDDLTIGMNIPPTNDQVAAAAAKINPNGNTNITQDTMFRANAIIGNSLVLNGYPDMISAVLTGNTSLDGPWFQCNEITQNIADSFTRVSNSKSIDEPIVDTDSDMKSAYNKKMQNMLVEMLNMFWWNMIWAKYLVDPLLIMPLRMLIYPADAIFYFLKKFKKPTRTIVEGTPISYTNAEGPLNKVLNKIRSYLLCKLPKRYYKRYTPPEGLVCPTGECNKSKSEEELGEQVDSEKAKLTSLKDVANKIFSDDEACIKDSDMVLDNILKPKEATGLGTPPDCIEAAKIVLDAIISDAFTPNSPTDLGLSIRS
jgi:hypothetical protein